jgi:hypothetical protein
VYAQPAAVYAQTAVYQPARPLVSASQQDLFNLRQENRAVNAAELNARANNMFYNTPWEAMFPFAPTAGLTSGFTRYGNTAKAKVNQLEEDRLQDKIDYFRATHPQPLSRDDQNALDDLVLQREYFRHQKQRRFSAAIPGAVIPSTGASIATFFDRRANEDGYYLAKNALSDTRENYQAKPDQENLVKLKNARDDVEQADDRKDASTFDLLGSSFNSAGRLGPIFRKKASQTKLDIGYRNLRAARQDFAQSPSEDNRMNLQLANLFIRATEQEDGANKADIVIGTLMPNVPTLLKAFISSGKNYQDESHLWLKYERLKRQILLRKQAKALPENADPVSARLLGLSMYGPAPGTQAPATTARGHSQ